MRLEAPTLITFPPEILLQITPHLHPLDVSTLRLTSHNFASTISQTHLSHLHYTFLTRTKPWPHTFFLATQLSKIGAIRTLITHCTEPTTLLQTKISSALISAASYGNRPNVVKVLLDCAKFKNLNLGTAPSEALLKASEYGHAPAVFSLLSSSLTFNITSSTIDAALCVAAKKGHASVLKILLMYGANPDGS
ncbi:hypothetical protein HK097_004356 [Rhizophlyctis rosea]|uniref:F-box domain-containing protein n=1 Tax=Rhizophlyctis rosea TaxID=64517 RepID=A0AAD5X6I3_9FUNG|nr:hypothetical protein HK097_004356 [Rhizophlyctis rosea]